MARSRIHPEERRARLLECGRRLWSRRSFDEITSRDISDETGVSIGLVYHYFGSKRGYYVATVRSVADELLDRTVLPESENLEAALRRAVEAFLEHFDDHAVLYRATLRGGVGFDPEVSEIADGVRDEIGARILRRLPTSSFDPDEARRLVVGWLGFTEAVALDRARHPGRSSNDVAHLALDAFRRLLHV